MPTPTTINEYRENECKELLKLGFPVLITQIGVILVNFIDTAMVGAYGVAELASSAFVNSVFLIPMVMLMGFSQGTTPLVGSLLGKIKKDETPGEDSPAVADITSEIGRTLRSGLETNIFLAIIFTILMGGVYFLLPYFGQDPDLLPIIGPYYLVMLPCMIPMALFNTCQQTSNGLNDTRTPMWIILGANLLNVIGNYALIFGHFGCPELGLFGAGISTLFARCSGAAAIMICFAKADRFSVYWKQSRAARKLRSERRQMFITSYPVMIQCGLEVTLWSFGSIVCGWFGKIDLAAYQVVNTIAQLGFMIFISFGVATSIRVAIFTGKKDLQAIRLTARTGLRINLFLATLACILFLFAGKFLIRGFTPDAAVIANAVALIPPLVLYQYMDATQLTYANALRGTSEVKPLMIVALISYVIVGIPAAYLLGVTFGWQNVGVYYSFCLALLVAALLLRFYFRRTLRKFSSPAA